MLDERSVDEQAEELVLLGVDAASNSIAVQPVQQLLGADCRSLQHVRRLFHAAQVGAGLQGACRGCLTARDLRRLQEAFRALHALAGFQAVALLHSGLVFVDARGWKPNGRGQIEDLLGHGVLQGGVRAAARGCSISWVFCFCAATAPHVRGHGCFQVGAVEDCRGVLQAQPTNLGFRV